jgi:SAM-dependent methyltransferase
MVWDPIWEEVFANQEWGKYPSEDLIRFIARNFYKAPSREEIKILEVGCGPGANLWYLAREGFNVFGLDGSKTAIQQAKTRLNKELHGWNGELQVGDMRDLPYNRGFFNAVIDNEAVYCNSFDDSVLIYKGIADVLKPGGKLYVRTFAQGSWGDETGTNIEKNAWNVGEGPLYKKGYSRFTSLEDLDTLFCDFRIIEAELVTRSYENRQKIVKEWMIIAEKTV